MPAVSVLIPAYNQGGYLAEAVQSILNQTCQDFEIIVVDDGSTDNTSQVAHSFNDPRIRYIYQENRGLAGARNTGILNSNASLITFLDADDLFMPGKLNLFISALNNEQDVGFIVGQTIVVDEMGKYIGKVMRVPLPFQPEEFILHNPIQVNSVMLRRVWLDKVGIFDENLPAYEDWDLWLRLVRFGCVMKFLEQPVSIYRFHKSQMTRDPARLKTASFTMLEKIFNDPELPQMWSDKHDLAYSHAYLRSAAQYYRAGLYERAKSDLNEAVILNPQLCDDGANLLAMQILGWANDPRTDDPINFLNRVYSNLPESFNILRDRRRKDIATAAVRYAFEFYRKNEPDKVKYYLFHAIRRQPLWLSNRGVLSILIKSILFKTRQL